MSYHCILPRCCRETLLQVQGCLQNLLISNVVLWIWNCAHLPHMCILAISQSYAQQFCGRFMFCARLLPCQGEICRTHLCFLYLPAQPSMTLHRCRIQESYCSSRFVSSPCVITSAQDILQRTTFLRSTTFLHLNKQIRASTVSSPG